MRSDYNRIVKIVASIAIIVSGYLCVSHSIAQLAVFTKHFLVDLLAPKNDELRNFVVLCCGTSGSQRCVLFSTFRIIDLIFILLILLLHEYYSIHTLLLYVHTINVFFVVCILSSTWYGLT